MLLQTANGIIKSNLKTRVNIKQLGPNVDAWVLDDTPLVLSVGKLVDENQFDFHWNQLSRKATLIRNRQKFSLTTQRGVPLLPAH